jgi:hypothetical protein
LIPKAVTVDNRRQLRIAGEVAIWTSVKRFLDVISPRRIPLLLPNMIQLLFQAVNKAS